MTETILRDQNTSNLFPVRAARFYLQQNSYELDPKKESELYEDHWPRIKIARLILDEAQRFNFILDTVLPQQNIPPLENLYTLDNRAVEDIFQKLFPLLEQLLSASAVDTFYENAVDPDLLKETREELAEVNAILAVPAQLAGTEGKRDAKARLLINRAQQNADASSEILHTDNVIHRAVDQLTKLDTSTPINPNLARYLGEQISSNSNIQNAAIKIARLEGEDREAALIVLQNIVQESVAQTLAEIPNFSRKELPSEPLIIPPKSASTPLNKLAETIVDRAFEAKANHTVLVDQTLDLLETTIVSSQLASQPATQTAAIPLMIQLVTDRVEATTGNSTSIPNEATTDLSNHLSDLLAAPNENTAKVVAQVIIDALPAETEIKNSNEVIDQATAAISALTVGQLVQNDPSPEIINTVANQSLNIITDAVRHFQPSTAITPQTAEVLIRANNPTVPLTENQTIDQLAVSFAPVAIDRRTAETIVRSFIQFNRSSDGEIIPNLSDTELHQIAILALSSTDAVVSPDLTKQATTVLAPPSTSPTRHALDLPAAAVNIQTIHFSPQLSGSLRNFSPSPPATKPGEMAIVQPNIVEQIRQALIARVASQYSATQLTVLNQEINLLFGRQLGQATAVLLADYFTQPTDRPVLTATYNSVEGINQTRASLSNPVNPSVNSITHHFSQIPGATTNNSLLQEILAYVSRHGADSRAAQLLQLGITRLQASFLLSKGICVEDLVRTRQYYIGRGPQANKERINEINRIITEIRELEDNQPKMLRRLNLSRRLRQSQLRQGIATPIQLPHSQYNTTIVEENLHNPRLLQAQQERLLSRLFGKGEIIVRGRSMQVNRLRYFQFKLNRLVYSQISRFRVGRVYLRFSRRLSQQGFEKLLKTKAQALGQATIKKLAGTAAGKAAGRTAARFAASAVGKGLTKVLSSVLVKLGITALAGAATGGIGFIVAAALEIAAKVYKKIINISKKLFSAIGGFTKSLLFGLANSDDIQIMSDRTKNIMIAGAVGFTVIFLPVILIGNIISGVFLQNPYDQLAAEFDGTGEIAEGCFIFSGDWTTEDKALANGALAKILSFKKYADVLCEDDKKIGLVRKNSSDWCSAGSGFITVTDRCLGTADNTLYSLAHESGHIYYQRSPETYASFGINVCGANGPTEGYICSYPIPPLSCGEDFPETIAVYIMNQFNKSYTFLGGCKKAIDLEKDYWTHYNFIYKYF